MHQFSRRKFQRARLGANFLDRLEFSLFRLVRNGQIGCSMRLVTFAHADAAKVTGDVRQRAIVRNLISDIPEPIATLSTGIPSPPGDIIATGTPAGVRSGFPPPRLRQGADVVEIAITNLGTIRNRIV
ncbi:fumarylacetoacetate hydrolase family protein [Nocardia sp. R6R-6]|uniref:fumarylacetoacetate hydrolase family protein n=1 Tax=Nocardia sp. R6R-6 TaxID=3459303 RepID=UPI00403D9C72